MLDDLAREREHHVQRIAEIDAELARRVLQIIEAEPLTARQRDVLTLIAQKFQNKEIADRLGISVRTVKFHVTGLLEKYNVDSRFDLARFGRAA